jgi:hypothetical protein
MSTPRQIEANRGNAQASTGPRTKAGKARASRNARRHGLSIAVTADPVLSQQVEDLARAIVGEAAGPELLAMARRFAEAQVDLHRIRNARRLCFMRLLVDEDGHTPGSSAGSEVDEVRPQQLRILKKLERYERRALSRRKAAAGSFDQTFIEEVRQRGFPPSSAATQK